MPLSFYTLDVVEWLKLAENPDDGSSMNFLKL